MVGREFYFILFYFILIKNPCFTDWKHIENFLQLYSGTISNKSILKKNYENNKKEIQSGAF